MLGAVTDPGQWPGGLALPLLGFVVLVAAAVIVLRVVRPLLKLLLVGGLILLVAFVWTSMRQDSKAPPAGGTADSAEAGIRASADGGWDVTVPTVEGVTAYRILLDGKQVAKTADSGVVHVSDPVLAATDYAPGPVRTLGLTLTVAGQDFKRAAQHFCSPVVVLAARGTGENPGTSGFYNGIGGRNRSTWLHLAEQAGVAPADPAVLPTVIGAAPVRFPAALMTDVAGRNAGKEDLRASLRAIGKDCPDSEIVLMGDGQGADVVGSVWQAQPAGVRTAVGVVTYADPHFNRAWVGQGVVWPKDAVFAHDGPLGPRGPFPATATERLQVWCLPKDPGCQRLPRPRRWQGDEYDVYAEWAAYNLAPATVEVLARQGFATAEPVAPTQAASTG